MQAQHVSAVLLIAVLAITFASAQDETCPPNGAKQAHALLQKFKVSSRSTLSVGNGVRPPAAKVATNPSGAAAPLDDEGYSAVADRCCQAEMKVFIERAVHDNGLQVCANGGLDGITPFHSCDAASSYEQLLTDLLESSASACPWVQSSSDACAPLPGPPACREYPEQPPAFPCSCSRGKASAVNLGAARVSPNNLDGQGPGTGASEMRIVGSPSAGTTSTGKAFDIVITNLNSYTRGTSNNEIAGDFAKILIGGSGSTTFRFEFVSPGTNTPVIQPEIHMAAFDLDGNPSGADTESVSSKGYTGYVTDPNPNSVASRLPDGRTEFKGIVSGSDPSSANDLTDAQKKSSIMFFYSNVSSFELTFGSNSAYQRGLMFAFESGLNERCGP